MIATSCSRGYEIVGRGIQRWQKRLGLRPAPLCAALCGAVLWVLPGHNAAAEDALGDAALNRIIESHWQWTLSQYPEMRLDYGDRSGNRLWTDMSPGAFTSRYEEEGEFVQQLEQIEPATLSSSGQVNRSMLLRLLRDNRTEYEDGLHLIALDMRSGPQHRHSMIERLPMETLEDYEDWLARLSALPEQLGQYRYCPSCSGSALSRASQSS